MEFDSYAFVLLRRPPGAPELSDAELERLQEAHLAHLAALGSAGKLVGAGPFSGQADESLRGVCVFATSVEEAQELMAQDPPRCGRGGSRPTS